MTWNRNHTPFLIQTKAWDGLKGWSTDLVHCSHLLVYCIRHGFRRQAMMAQLYRKFLRQVSLSSTIHSPSKVLIFFAAFNAFLPLLEKNRQNIQSVRRETMKYGNTQRHMVSGGSYSHSTKILAYKSRSAGCLLPTDFHRYKASHSDLRLRRWLHVGRPHPSATRRPRICLRRRVLRLAGAF